VVPAPEGIAPEGAIPGERYAADGANAVAFGAHPVVLRVDAAREEHVAFAFTFSAAADVVMQAVRWDGGAAVDLPYTNAGAGRRFLSVLDPDDDRTYWVRLSAAAGAAGGTLTVTRTPFVDGPRCTADCARLLQLPLPNDPAVDGYDTDGGTHYRYWFGRRDLLMMVRHAARQNALDGRPPFFPYDFSQWDGNIPGTDTGSLRHVSHQRGKDVDISLFGQDGSAVWRSYCTTTSTSDGRECMPGTRRNFAGEENALSFGAHLESGRVTMSFLDRELIPAVRSGAAAAAARGALDGDLLPLYSDGRTLQHWPNHDNHIHERVSEQPYDGKALLPEPFEAP
jgi:hypothetical protein